jgi:hypothetical protein
MKADLPLEVLGQLGPILSWVEPREGATFPQSWQDMTAKFGEREQSWLVHELPTYSYDTIEEIIRLSRDDMKYKGPAKSKWKPLSLRSPAYYNLSSIFKALSERYFRWSGGKVAVRERRMVELHELGLRFPAGHLVQHARALAVAQGVIDEERARKWPEILSLLPSNSFGLRTVVRRGLSEGHLHLQGVHSAEESWPDVLLRNFHIDAAGRFPEQERRLMTLARFSGRLLALAVLIGRMEELGEATPVGHLPFHLLDHLDRLYFAPSRVNTWFARQRMEGDLQQFAVREGRRFNLLQRVQRYRELSWLYEWVVPASPGLLKTFRGVVGAEHLRRRGTQQRRDMLEDLHFHAHRLLLTLPESSPATPVRSLVHETLYRYLIIRTHYWQLITQHGKTTGLARFKRSYEAPLRKPPLATDLEKKQLIFERLQGWRGLRVLEGRISPPTRIVELRPWLQGYAEGADQKRIQKFGMVVHFVKSEKHEVERPARKGGIPQLRFGRVRRRTRRQAFGLFRLLSSPHPAVPFIVGIDDANLELTTPPEVYAPAFRFLHSLPIELRRSPYRHLRQVDVEDAVRNLVERRRLGMTYHVGEDFRHLLSGLRAIAEVLEYLGPQPGDRLGHATALGLDPEVWARQVGYQAVVPRLEWLDDLVWLYSFLGPGDDTIGELGVEDRIQHLSWKVYRPFSGQQEKDWSPLALHDAWRMRQLDPYFVDLEKLKNNECKLRTPQGKYEAHHFRWWQTQLKVHKKVEHHIGSAQACQLLHAYWFDREVRVEGDKPEIVDLDTDRELWMETLKRVQKKLIDRIQRREVVIEVNPSVNRVIGPMSKLEEHHIFKLTFDKKKRIKRQIRVTINTDNPAVFNTSLAHEYYLLGEVLLREGKSEPEVVEWLEWLRQNGEDYSFVRQLPDTRDPNLRKVLDFVRRARPSVREPIGRAKKLHYFWRWWNEQQLPYASRILDPESVPERVQFLEREVQRLRSNLEEGHRKLVAHQLADLEAKIRQIKNKTLT